MIKMFLQDKCQSNNVIREWLDGRGGVVQGLDLSSYPKKKKNNLNQFCFVLFYSILLY